MQISTEILHDSLDSSSQSTLLFAAHKSSFHLLSIVPGM